VWSGPEGWCFGGGDAAAHLDMTQSWQYFNLAARPSCAVDQAVAQPGGSRTFPQPVARPGCSACAIEAIIAVGAHAYICVFDPTRIGPTKVDHALTNPAGPGRPHLVPGIGIEEVFVTGFEAWHSDS